MSSFKTIIKAWANVIWESEPVRLEAARRAKVCGACSHCVDGKVPELIGDKIKDVSGKVCDLCSCPLKAKIRSDEICEKWQTVTP
jgi:hypothetical protein